MAQELSYSPQINITNNSTEQNTSLPEENINQTEEIITISQPVQPPRRLRLPRRRGRGRRVLSRRLSARTNVARRPGLRKRRLLNRGNQISAPITKKVQLRPPTSIMVNCAINKLTNESRRSVSLQAIKKYIAEHFDVNPQKISRYINRSV